MCNLWNHHQDEDRKGYLYNSVLCGSQQTVENSFKNWDYQTTWSASWEIYMQVRKQQLELDMEQQTGPKLENKYTEAVYMQSTLCEMLG